MRKIPAKNYIIVGLLVVATVFLGLGIRKTYLDKLDYELSNNATLSFLSSINEDELQTYLVENREIILYMSNSSDESLKDFELSLRDYILENQLSQDIIYINTHNVSKKFFKSFKTKYFSSNLRDTDLEVIDQPNLFLIENGKVVSVMYGKKSLINLDDVKKFIIDSEV